MDSFRLWKIAAWLLPLLLFAYTPAKSASSETSRVIYIGLTSQADLSIERIKRLNVILQEDIHTRLAQKVKLTDLSEAYIYSQTADIRSIAATSRARWVIYGKAEKAKDRQTIGSKTSFTIKLYDAATATDAETVTFEAFEKEKAKICENLEYIYSHIAAVNNYFYPEQKQAAKQVAPLSPKRVMLLKFMQSADVPSDFDEINTAAQKTIFQRKYGSPDKITDDRFMFMNMLTKNYESTARLAKMGQLTGARWVICGTLSKTNKNDVRCIIKLIDIAQGKTADEVTAEGPAYALIKNNILRGLNGFVLKISAANGYAFHESSGFTATKLNLPASEGISGTVFNGSILLVAGNGKIFSINMDGSMSEPVNSKGKGIKKFSASNGVQSDQFGRMYIMDTEACKILVFDKAGGFVSEFFYGARNAKSFVVTSGGYVFIPDIQNGVVQIYTKDGSHIKDAYPDSPANSRFELCLFRGNPVIVAKGSGGYTQTFLSQTGSLLRIKKLDLQTDSLSVNAAAMDSSENMYCIDSANNLIFCVSKTGTISWVQKSLSGISPAAFNAPTSIACNFSGSRLTVIDSGQKRLVQLRRPEQKQAVK